MAGSDGNRWDRPGKVWQVESRSNFRSLGRLSFFEPRREIATVKIVFLDIDGVLNHHDWWRRRGELPDDSSSFERYLHDLDPIAVGYLNEIVAATGAKVVISSAWRLHPSLSELRGLMKKAGFVGDLIDKTPRIPAPRGREIQLWIDEAALKVDRFVILDDDDDMEHLSEHLIKTSMFHGLLPSHVEAAIAIMA